MLVEYDLDLCHPVARFSTVQGNVRILRSVVCDGTVPAVFSLPSVPGRSCSPWFADYHRRLTVAVQPWLRERGFSLQLQDAWLELTLAERMVRRMLIVLDNAHSAETGPPTAARNTWLRHGGDQPRPAARPGHRRGARP